MWDTDHAYLSSYCKPAGPEHCEGIRGCTFGVEGNP
jgi:hypothetical protein